MAATDEMVAIALQVKPHAVCLVPERREEVTTEGGLDVVGRKHLLRPVVARLTDAGIRVSMFIAAEPAQLEATAAIGARSSSCTPAAIVEHEGEHRDATFVGSSPPRDSRASSDSNATQAMG